MSRCSYTWEEWDEEKSDFARRRCLEKTWSRSEEFCIFHDPSPDKDSEQFEEKLREKLAEKDYFFDGYFFPEIDFRNEMFKGKAFFNNAIFQDAAFFTGATFQKNADFSGATFQRNANFWKATFQGNANFSSASFQEIANFREATFQGTVEFRRTIFQKTADFTKGIFQDGNLEGTTFLDKAFFSEAIFHRDAKFTRAIFNADAYFTDATFQRKAIFLSATFQKTYFRMVTFKSDTDFSQTSFKDYTSFYGSDFPESTDFLAARFEGHSDFRNTTFGSANFRGSIFEKGVEFSPNLIRELDLRDTYFLFRSNMAIDLSKTMVKGAFMENVAFIDCTRPDDLIIYEEEHMKDKEINLSFNELETIYRELRQNMQRHGDYDTAGKFYYREMEMKRKQYKLFRKKWWTQNILHILCGYGEKPLLVIRNAILIVILGAISYFFSGIARVGAEVPADSSPYIINYSLNSLNLSSAILNDLFYCLYYSVVTFTTLGYGDIHPVGKISHAVSFIEAFIGAFFIALFVVVFMRKMAR